MNKGTIIAVDFGGTSVKLAKVVGSKIIEKYDPIHTANYHSAAELKAELMKRLREIKDSTVKGVGIGVPGLVKQPQGLVVNLGNVEGWSNIALAEEVSQELGVPCKVDNDANCAALAEARFGAGQNQELMLMVTLGTGVGSGIISHGNIWHGAHGYAGEIGRLQVPSLNSKTQDIDYQILDKICGHSAISKQAISLYQAQGIHDDLDSKSTLPYLAKKAREGDQIALQVWQTMARNLALGLANANALLNPSMIVIGGGVAAAADVFLDELKAHFEKLTWAESLELNIVVAKFGNDAGLIGAAQLLENR